MRAAARVLCTFAGVLLSVPAAAQLPAPAPPGPYVIDVRGATGGLPTAPAFFPDLDAEDDTITVPSRGFGLDVGGHVYKGGLGPARLGFGANLLRVQGTTVAVKTAVTALASQLSFNFGNSDGWSYLGLGYGVGRVREGGWVPAINVGGGARWFLTRHMAFGFDLRYHRFSAGDTTPTASLFAVSAGVSLR